MKTLLLPFAGGLFALAAGLAPAAPQDGGADPERPSRIERLERLLAERPDDARLMGQLGRAYLMSSRTGETKDIPRMIALFERGRALDPSEDFAFELGFVHMIDLAGKTRAREPDEKQLACLEEALRETAAGIAKRPEDAALVSMHGMALVLKGVIAEDPRLFGPGIAELDRGVALQPGALHPRLARGFTLLGMPPEAGQTGKVIDDLETLLTRVGPERNPQAAGMLQVFVGDLHLEGGRRDRAVAEYRDTLALESTAAAEARRRLAVLEAGGEVDPADIARFRGSRIQCASCHADAATLEKR